MRIGDAVGRAARKAGVWAMSQTWTDMLFLHWAVRPERLLPMIPAELTLDTLHAKAWVSVVAFRVAQIKPLGWPLPGLPPESFELNLRTYVRHGREPGVHFLSLATDSGLTIWGGQAIYGLPYEPAAAKLSRGRSTLDVEVLGEDGQALLEATYRGRGACAPAREGSDEEWLMERRFAFLAGDEGVSRLSVSHPRWSLRRASLRLGEVGIASRLVPRLGRPDKSFVVERTEALLSAPEPV